LTTRPQEHISFSIRERGREYQLRSYVDVRFRESKDACDLGREDLELLLS
jgi:hypothetical protein